MVTKRFFCAIVTWPKIFDFGQVLFWPACMCLCVCLSVCVSVCLSVFTSIISKSSWPILMKFGMMMYYDEIQLLFEDGLHLFDRAHTSPIWNFVIAISHKVLH